MSRFLIIFSSIVLIVPFRSQIAVAETNPEVYPKLKNFIEKIEVQKPKLQGGAIAILHKDEVIYKTTFGNQRGNQAPIHSKTLFPLASVSKSISATAIAFMVEQGKLSFEEEFKLPYLKNTVNLTHILGHTTGYIYKGNVEIEQGLSRKRLLAILNNKIPKDKPGKHYAYSNLVFSLLEDVLDTKNLKFELVIQELRKMLQTDEVQILPIDFNGDIAYPHLIIIDKTKNKRTYKALPFPPHYPRLIPSSAGVFASLDGMIEIFKLSFGYRPDLISKKAITKLQTPIITNTDVHKWYIKWPHDKNKIESYYGLGWRILRAKTYPTIELVCHSGYISGINTFIGFIPAYEVGIIILANQDSSFATQEGINFWAQFLK